MTSDELRSRAKFSRNTVGVRIDGYPSNIHLWVFKSVSTELPSDKNIFQIRDAILIGDDICSIFV